MGKISISYFGELSINEPISDRLRRNGFNHYGFGIYHNSQTKLNRVEVFYLDSEPLPTKSELEEMFSNLNIHEIGVTNSHLEMERAVI
ncbi:MAG: hypothetical protein U1B79_00370 [Candidatus Pacearchaeota archaeon]|nr:hypothetical protein [Nanoarchaeota archaeon]MDZ4226550.1 hypothetical protein [Candidatus Pacearchaeota archaeon]